MALNYKILTYKNVVEHNGKSFVDLSSTTFDKDLTLTGTFIIVNEMYVGRPDLVSFAVYGTDEYADVICKVNGISNPFEMNEDDLIFIPSIEYIMQCCKVFNKADDFIDSDKESLNPSIDNSTIYQKELDEKRSSWEQTKGDKNYIIDNSTGLIFY